MLSSVEDKMVEVTGPRAVSFLVLPILPDAVRSPSAACLTANSNNQLYISYSISLLVHFAVADASRDVRDAALL
jgi:hypothetical protein